MEIEAFASQPMSRTRHKVGARLPTKTRLGLIGEEALTTKAQSMASRIRGRGGAELKGWRDTAYVLVAATAMVALLYLAALSMIAEYGYRHLVATPFKTLGRLITGGPRHERR